MKPQYWNKGKIYLSNKDRVLKNIINKFPNENLILNDNYYHALLNSIIGQQISVSAANAIKKRFYFGPVDISRLQLQILDEFGRVLDLNNMDYSMALNLVCLYD